MQQCVLEKDGKANQLSGATNQGQLYHEGIGYTYEKCSSVEAPCPILQNSNGTGMNSPRTTLSGRYSHLHRQKGIAGTENSSLRLALLK
jgi:hypothetical protein